MSIAGTTFTNTVADFLCDVVHCDNLAMLVTDTTSTPWNYHVSGDRRCKMWLPALPITTGILTVIIIIVLTLTTAVTGHDDAHYGDDRGLDFREPASDTAASHEALSQRYGTEVSWPMQRQGETYDDDDDHRFTSKYPNYVEYMNGCAQQYDRPTCQSHDTTRIQRNNLQPKTVPRNYTHAGYAKVAAPAATFSLLREYWDRYATSHLQLEHAGGHETKNVNNLHLNHWSAPTKILYLDPPPSRRRRHLESTTTVTTSPLPHMPRSNIHTMIDQVQDVLEQWTGVPLQFTSVYGIRSYSNHSILAPHIDRIPLVISAIVNVAQQVTDDWILELMGHDGWAMNLTMQPGDMILYESHSIIHGRPYPLNGQYYANCFFHFEPIGYTEQYYANLERRRRDSSNDSTVTTIKTTKERYEAALAQAVGPTSTSQSLSTESVSENTAATAATTTIPLTLPHDIPEGTIEAQRWRQEFEFHRVTLHHEGWEDINEELFPKVIPKKNHPKKNTVGATNAHIAAARNDMVHLREVARTDRKSLDTSDVNGWYPLHEAARGGGTDAVRFLVEEIGVADINARTNDGQGGTALWWAEHTGLPADHEIIRILKRNGAVSIAPFQKKKPSIWDKVGAMNKKNADDEDDGEDKEK